MEEVPVSNAADIISGVAIDHRGLRVDSRKVSNKVVEEFAMRGNVVNYGSFPSPVKFEDEQESAKVNLFRKRPEQRDTLKLTALEFEVQPSMRASKANSERSEELAVSP